MDSQEFLSLHKREFSVKDIAHHILTPPDVYIAKLQKTQTIKMTNNIGVFDEKPDFSDLFSIGKIKKIVDDLNLKPIQERIPFYKSAKKYFDGLAPEYYQQLISLIDQLDPIKPTVKASVCIAVAADSENKNVYNGLLQYAKQKGIKRQEFDIVLFLNDTGDPIRQNQREETISEIKRFKKDYPDINVTYCYKILSDSEKNIVAIKRYASNLTVLREYSGNLNERNPIIIENDIDTIDMDSHYIKRFIEYHKKNPLIDASIQTIDLDNYREKVFPVLMASGRFYQFINFILRKNSGFTVTPGYDTSIKSSSYCLIAPYLMGIEGGDDILLGIVLNTIRNPEKVVEQMLTKNPSLILSSRRVINTYLEELALNEMWKLGHGTERRHKLEGVFATHYRRAEDEKDYNLNDPQQLERFLGETKTQLEKMVHVYLEKYPLSYDAPIFKEALKYIGIDGYFENGQLIINDYGKLVEAMKLINT